MRWKPAKYLLLLFLQGVAHAFAQPAVFKAPTFLQPPFPDGVVMMAQGPRYSDNHAPHLGAGFAFD